MSGRRRQAPIDRPVAPAASTRGANARQYVCPTVVRPGETTDRHQAGSVSTVGRYPVGTASPVTARRSQPGMEPIHLCGRIDAVAVAYPRTQEGTILTAAWDLLDLGAALVLVVATDAVVLSGAGGSVLGLALVLATVFVAPGYVWVAALRPRNSNRRPAVLSGEPRRGTEEPMGPAERLLLAAGASVGLVTVVGFVLHYAGIGIGTVTTLEALTAVVLAGCVVAAVRRLRIDRASRFGPEALLRPLLDARGLVSARTRLDLGISLLLVGSLVVGAAGVAAVAASVDDRASFTEFSLTAANETGQEVAAGASAAGDSLVVGVGNHEGEPVTYTVVVQREQVADGTGETSRVEATRFSTEVPPGGTWETGYTVPEVPDARGADTRLTFLLYADEPPADPSRETAYRAVHTWIEPGTDSGPGA